MTATTGERFFKQESWQRRELTLASGYKANKGALAALDLSIGKVRPAAASVGLLVVIGTFAANVDATSGDKKVDIDFHREFQPRRFINSVVSPVAATDVGKFAYIEDDQTVSLVPAAGAPVAGRVWDVDAVKGVLVETLSSLPSGSAPVATLPAFAAGNLVVPAVTPGAIYDVPTTAAVSTVTLPASSVEGAIVYFVADGVKNGHTVQYRDATGPTLLTTALVASKRHQVTAIFLNGKWSANAYVAP